MLTQTLFTFFHPTHRKELTFSQSSQLSTHLLLQYSTLFVPLLQVQLLKVTSMTSRFTEYHIPSLLLSVSVLPFTSLQTPKKRSSRQEAVLFRYALQMHLRKLQRTSTSGLLLLQAGSASLRLLIAQFSSGHTTTVTAAAMQLMAL